MSVRATPKQVARALRAMQARGLSAGLKPAHQRGPARDARCNPERWAHGARSAANARSRIMVKVQYAHTAQVETFDSEDAAIASLRRTLGADMFTTGEGGSDRIGTTLVYRTEEACEGDSDGSRAAAKLTHAIADDIPYIDPLDHCEMCKAVREHAPVQGEDVVILVDDADVQPVDAVRAPDGWLSWDIGGGWAFACAACTATLTLRAPVEPIAETYLHRMGQYLVTFGRDVTVNVHNGASGQRGPTWYAMKPSDQRISGEECSAYQRAALTFVLGALGITHTLRVDRVGDIIATVQS